jgi:hypothetical protein
MFLMILYDKLRPLVADPYNFILTSFIRHQTSLNFAYLIKITGVGDENRDTQRLDIMCIIFSTKFVSPITPISFDGNSLRNVRYI